MKIKRSVKCILAAVLIIAILQPGSIVSDTDTYAAGSVSTYNALVSNIKSELLARNTNISLVYTGPLNGLSAAALFKQAVNDARADSATTAPNEGDYILYSMDKYTVSASTSGSTSTYTASITYRDNASKEQQVASKINQLKSEWNIGSLSDVEKVKHIHDYVVTHVTYDNSRTHYTAYDALIGGSSVCQGYALLTYRLCKTFGIDARIVSGYKKTDSGGKGENHAWNIVKVNGKYYNLDATWDSTIANGSGIRYDYFLISDADLVVDHERDPEYQDPSFVSKYPVSTETYYFDEPMLNKTPVAYSFNTLEGTPIASDTAKPTVLVIGGTNDKNFVKQVKHIKESEISSNSSVRFASVDINDETSAVFNLLRNSGVISGNTTDLPVTLLIDQNNSIQFAYKGEVVRASRIIRNLNKFSGISIKTTQKTVYSGTSSDKTSSSSSSGNSSASGTSKSGSSGSTATYVKKGYIYKTKKLIYKVTKSGASGCKVTVKKAVKKTIKSVKIPATVKIKGVSYKVVSISKNAFKGCKKLKKVVVGPNVTSIKSGAFSGCKNIKKVGYYTSNGTKVINALKKLIGK